MSTESNQNPSDTTKKQLTMREAARLALEQYHETFRDLARHDSGELSMEDIIKRAKKEGI